MQKQKTWDVLELGIEAVDKIALSCPNCGTDAVMPIGDTSKNPVIAAIGISLIFDRPSATPKVSPLPTTIRCRTCRRVFTRKEEV
jgi:hypothetical protein